MELLNDERVLKILETAEQAPYAMSIIEVLGRSNRLPLVPQMLCMVDNKKNTKRRIQMMQLGEVFKKYRILIAVICLVIIGVLSVLFLTTQPKKTSPEVTNTGDVDDLPGDEMRPLADSSIIGGADGPTEIILQNGAESGILTDYLPSNSSMSVGYHDGQFMTEVVDTRQLTMEELEYFNQKYFNADDYNYLANQFLLDAYDTPANVDLAMLFYNGVGVDYAMSVEELEAVTKAYGFEELPTDVTVIPSSAMNQAWSHFVGLPLAEENIRALSSLLYLEKYDCYYHLHGDVNRYGDVTFTRGEQTGNAVELYYHNTWFDQDFVLRLLQYEDNTYKIYFNLPE